MAIKLTIAIFFLVNLALQAQNEEKKYESERLTRQKNHIQQILTYQFNLATNDSSLITHNFYDSAGNCVQRHEYSPVGKLQYRATLTYNNKGLQTLETGYDGDGNLIQLFAYSYDKDGHRTVYQQLNADKKILNYQKSVFNSKGQRVKLYNQLKDQGGFYLSATFVYDSASRSVGSTMYSVDGDTGSSDEYAYDSRDNLTEVYQLIDQQKTLLFKNRYNDKNQLVETQFYRKNKFIADGRPESIPSDRRIVFTYDEGGNKIEESTWNKTTLVKRTRYYFIKKQP